MIKTNSIINKKLMVEYKNYSIVLNSYLLSKQKKDNDNDIKKIKDFHLEKFKIFEKMESTNDIVELHKYANSIKDLEFKLQDAWGFDIDENFHRWWNVPKCKCPTIDNEEMYGMPFNIINENCPVHGKSNRIQLLINKKPGYYLIQDEYNNFKIEFSFKKYIKDILNFLK